MKIFKATSFYGITALIALLSSASHAAQPGIEWLVDCPRLPGSALDQEVVARTQCAVVTVPRDHAAPQLGTQRFKITRVGARQPLARRGVVFIHPGKLQTGTQGVFAVHLASVWQHYNTPAYRQLTDLYDLIELTPRSLDKAASAEQSARDMDYVRAQLNEERIHYLGNASGTLLGAWYGALFAQRVERMVLIQADRDHPAAPDNKAMALAPLPAIRSLSFKGQYLQDLSSNNAGLCVNRWTGDYLAFGKRPPRSAACLDTHAAD